MLMLCALAARLRTVLRGSTPMTSDDLFNPRAMPGGLSPAHVQHVNDIVRRLRARRVERIEVPEPGSRFQLSNTIRAYNQAHLRRALMFIEAAHHHVSSGSGLVALTAVRCVFETVANFLDFEGELQALLSEGDLKKIHEFMRNRAHATRLENLKKAVGTPDVQAKSILTQINKMTKERRPKAREEYDYLCEYAHPNAFGGMLYFAHDDRSTDFITFSDRGQTPEDDLNWVLD
jgi:hypothetical protein